MNADALFLQHALKRVYRFMLAAGAAGLVVSFLLWGWRGGLGFAAGAAASYLNFSWLHQVVEALGPDARPTKKRLFVFVALRYLILGLGGYVIVKIFGMNVIAALTGLFVPAAAVILESLYELTHAGT